MSRVRDGSIGGVMEDRLKAEFIVTNSEGNVTVSMTLGQMKIEDIKALEAV